eukprot:14853035-Alexandrium_andersonii.AAC.1
MAGATFRPDAHSARDASEGAALGSLAWRGILGSARRCAREGRLGLCVGGPAPVVPAHRHHAGVAQGLVVQPVAG